MKITSSANLHLHTFNLLYNSRHTNLNSLLKYLNCALIRALCHLDLFQSFIPISGPRWDVNEDLFLTAFFCLFCAGLTSHLVTFSSLWMCVCHLISHCPAVLHFTVQIRANPDGEQSFGNVSVILNTPQKSDWQNNKEHLWRDWKDLGVSFYSEYFWTIYVTLLEVWIS